MLLTTDFQLDSIYMLLPLFRTMCLVCFFVNFKLLDMKEKGAQSQMCHG